jgi:hypothetical protein
MFYVLDGAVQVLSGTEIVRAEYLVEYFHHRCLGDFVFQGCDSQRPLPTIVFVDPHFP